MLKAVGDLYLSMNVLILLDLTYFGRFWTSFEAWCAMQKTTPEGLTPVADGNVRYEIMCIHNAKNDPETFRKMLVGQMASLSVQQAYDLLKKPDIVVTNAKDKDVMLPILLLTDKHVREVFSTAEAMQASKLPEKQKKELAEAKRAQARKLPEKQKEELTA